MKIYICTLHYNWYKNQVYPCLLLLDHYIQAKHKLKNSVSEPKLNKKLYKNVDFNFNFICELKMYDWNTARKSFWYVKSEISNKYIKAVENLACKIFKETKGF